MIKTIVFDLGGVYFEPGTTKLLKKDIIDAPKEKIEEVFRGYPKKEGWLYRKGEISEKEFWEKAIKKLGIDKRKAAEIKDIWHSDYVPISGMEELVLELKGKYRLVVFSGNIKERIEYLDKKYGLYNKFDELVFSFDIGLSKREMKMYEILLEKINCKPEECVCIDDSERVLEIEKSLGMQNILFKSAEQVREELRNLGVKI